MKAIVCKSYGDTQGLSLEDRAIPYPQSHEVRVKVHATTVTAADSRIRRLHIPKGFGVLSRLVFGVFAPRQPILGSEFAGEIDALGENVTHYRIGDQVFGITGMRMGCHAEYLCIHENAALTHAPTRMPLEHTAALSFGGTAALYFLRKAQLHKGEHILINGASGSVGTAAVQLARYFGAKITAVCSTNHQILVKSLGADHVIDYTQEPIFASNQFYDVIIDTVGNLDFSQCQKSLTKSGRLALVSANLPQMLLGTLQSWLSKKKLIIGTAPEQAADLAFLAHLVEQKQFSPVIDQFYTFAQFAEAHQRVDSGHKKGNLILLPR